MGHSDSSWRLTMDSLSGNRFNPGNGPELQFANISDELTNGMFVNNNTWHFVAGNFRTARTTLFILRPAGQERLSRRRRRDRKRAGCSFGWGSSIPSPATAGARSRGRRPLVDGSLAQVAFFTNALNQAQVQQLYTTAGVAPFFLAAS